jgi:hypothetical protein
MTVLGLGQVIDEFPDRRDRYLGAMRACAAAMQTDAALSFGTQAWGEEGLASLDTGHGHAYLGYLALALGVLRQHDPDAPEVAIHDGLIEALYARVSASASLTIETYPGEAYPADMAAVIGAIGQHARVTGVDRSDFLSRWSANTRDRFVDPESGLLYQSVDPVTGEPSGEPRGSGTAIAVYFLSYADPELSARLYESLADECYREPLGLGFGGVREYPPGTSGVGDVDSGPVVFGFGTSATGFSLAGARMNGDQRAYRGVFRTAFLLGVPVRHAGRWRYLTGGALGNAIMLAMLTARSRPARRRASGRTSRGSSRAASRSGDIRSLPT